MKFSIQEVGKEKQIFVNFQEAEQQTGIPRGHILHITKRANPNYRRRSDGKRFIIKQESEEPFAKIDGKVFFTIEEVANEFGISRTLFINQILKGQSFLDSSQRSHDVNWRSEELEKCLDRLRQWRLAAKVQRKIGTARPTNERGERNSMAIPLSESLLQ